MARTPAENIATLKAYWSLVTLNRGEVADLVRAQNAMRELLIDAQSQYSDARKLFAAESVFETALAQDPKGDTLVALVRKLANTWGGSGWGETRSLRQMMFDGIRTAALGSFWYPIKDPTGVTLWLHSADVAGKLFTDTMRSDRDPAVRAAAMTLVRDVAIPRAWATSFLNQNVFNGIIEALVTSPYSLKERQGLQQLAGDALGSVQRALAPSLEQITQAAQPAPAPVPTTGSGKATPTLPPPTGAKQPWYKNGPVVMVGLVALIGLGGVLYVRARRVTTRQD